MFKLKSVEVGRCSAVLLKKNFLGKFYAKVLVLLLMLLLVVPRFAAGARVVAVPMVHVHGGVAAGCMVGDAAAAAA